MIWAIAILAPVCTALAAPGDSIRSKAAPARTAPAVKPAAPLATKKPARSTTARKPARTKAARADSSKQKTADLFASPLWDDGRAEISQYRGTTLRYGEPRPTRARISIVKEDMLRDARVKSDRGPLKGRTADVLKVVFYAEFPTGSYFYRQAATTFLDRTSLDVLKENMSHFDNCGITYVRIGPKRGRTVHEAHSYWEGEADREVELTWPAGNLARVYWDALPLWLRQRLPRGEAIQVLLLPSQVGGRSPIEATRPVVAAIRWSDAGTIAVPAGRFAARLAEVDAPQGTDRFWFDARFPYVMIKVETAAGRTLALEKTQRLDYWNHHALGDEKLVE
jgi:hypothetical protein